MSATPRFYQSSTFEQVVCQSNHSGSYREQNCVIFNVSTFFILARYEKRSKILKYGSSPKMLGGKPGGGGVPPGRQAPVTPRFELPPLGSPVSSGAEGRWSKVSLP